MWINRKPSLRQPSSTQNIQPSKPHPQSTQSLSSQIDQLSNNIFRYSPVSQLVNINSILASPCQQLKKFRQSVFLGQMHEGKRKGLGIMLYVNGRVYEGQWVDNFKQGKGFEKFSNGSVYRGDYVKGRPEGCGRYQWDNGEVYEGQWLNGLKHGSGIWRGAKGDSYIGEWRQGRADGYGVHTWVNGDRYEGEFKDCLKHGEGVQHFFNGDSYKGNYEKGKPCGYGEYYWASASFFKGQFKGGLRCGEGVWKKGAGRSDKYEGGWLDDKKEGYGVFTWADGSVYKGNFANDIKQGYGQMVRTDGSVFKGKWQCDRPIQEPEMSIEHDQDCQLLMPNTMKGYMMGELLTEDHGPHVEELPQHPLYLEPQRPVMKSTSRHLRPRNNFTRTTVRNQIRSRGESQGGRRQTVGMVKKMSAGTVRGKSQLGRPAPNNPKAMSSSFFLYKINGQQNAPKRQTKTSGGSRGRPSQIEEELKYFARHKMGSFTQFH